MKISDAFDAYTADVASVHSYRAAIQDAADREFAHLKEQETRRQQANLSPSHIVGMQNLCFRTADTGRHHFYAFKDVTIQAQIDALVRRTNRQYQWLLAEAYELFEDFLENAYACAALENKNLWPLRDFGALTFDELASVTFDKLLEQAKSKKDKPQSLLHPLREKLHRMKVLETRNSLNTNLWFKINFIEKLRHHIVHTRGAVADKQQFAKDLLSKIGLYNSGKPEKEYLELIDTYVRPDGDAHVVRLLDVALPAEGPFAVHLDIFDDLSDGLLAYAHLLTTCFAPVESKQPNTQKNGT